ncbi:hypothetical protein N0V82_003345 [Gnomoniopsis sp. IMI 355080]|nr:hypothetical protein N0V82_003345 [Gnomoniopsis sp. IMI 355080]
MDTSATTPRDDTTDAPHHDPAIDPANGGLPPANAAHAAPQQQQQQSPVPVQNPSQPAQCVQAQPEGATSHATPSAMNVPDPGQPSENDSSIIDKGPGMLHLHQDILASPRHELELIPEDHPISTPHHDTGIASPRAASSTFTGSNQPSTASTPDPGVLIRPAALQPIAHPLPSRPSTRSPISSISPVEEPLSPAIIRTASGRSRLRHPTPDINARSGSYTSNIAALEATAERFSMTSSIDDAIREAHNDLKRSDSRRSSILAASVRSGDHGTDSPLGLLPPIPLGQQSSIVGLNNAARTGGYSPGGFIMSPTQSITGRLRSASKGSSALSRANSTRSKPETLDGEAFPNLSGSMMSGISRNGPGTGSVRSIRSARSMHSVHSVQSNRSGPPLSLAEIAEMEPPSALTRAAMDEADRTVPRLEDLGDDDDAILARAHQQVEQDATDIQVAEEPDQRLRSDWERTPMLGELNDSYWDNHDEGGALRIRNPASPTKPTIHDDQQPSADHQQYEHCETPDTIDEANAFADFDGMHCDPDSVAEHFPYHPEEGENVHSGQAPSQVQARPRPPAARPARPQSYFDPETGQNMLYYPAHVPAMLNLPPKLGKGVKAAEAARNIRRSQLLSQMPKPARESRVWLPDPLEDSGSLNLSPMPLMGDATTPTSHQSSTHGHGPEDALAALERPGTGLASHENSLVEASGSQNLRRPPRLGDPDARKSRMNLSELPPQLRASVFFDMPNATIPKIEVKNGSAMDTLDSILDAAASAPVNAFTDHAIAGHLGNEVYGNKKKKNRQSQLTLAVDAGEGKTHRLSKSASTLALPEAEKRKSVWSLLPGFGKSKSSVNLLNVQEADARSRLSGSVEDDSASDVDENSALAPDDESSSEEEEEFSGQPTTLLAELQMRKQHQKKRTVNPLHQGNALHSTLLELDAVAQYEAESRQRKKVNLAWAADSPEVESEDDEDVPLGLLAARKQLGANATDHDMAFAAQELNRPLGLMEKRELDDNEPLSRRRDRLQGKPVTVSMYLQPSRNATRLSVMPGSHSRSASPLRMVPATSPGASAASPNPEEGEVPGETLGERMRRLRAKDDGDNPLPRARPVSGAFSTELLSELGIGEKEKDSGRGKENTAPVVEEEETLGQRRRRLQAEREAREKEMATHTVLDDNQTGATSRRLNMADVLAANPLAVPGQVDPREVERRRKEEEASQYTREQEAKMRAFRAQIPQAISDGKGGIVAPGGFQNGRFNDSRGGLGNSMDNRNHLRASMSMNQLAHGRGQSTNLIGAAGTYNNPNVGPNGMSPVFNKTNPFGNGYSGGILQSHPQFNNQPQPFVSGTLLASGGYGAFGGGIGAAGGYPANQTAYGAGVGFAGGMPVGYSMQAGNMQMMTGQQQSELVERWRQGIR